jgi:hypothetical protein
MKRTIGLLAATASFALLPLGVASADYPVDDPEITVENGTPGPGDAVDVAVANFCPDTQVNFYIVPDGSLLGSATTDGTGYAEFQFPAPSEPGSYTVNAEGTGNCTSESSAVIDVGELGATGSESTNTLQLGLLVLGAGALLIGAASWRRRSVGA